MNWYALHVRSNFEKLVALQLERVGIEPFYPHLLVKSKDNRREVERKFFPGYVFGHFDFRDRQPVLEIPQVVKILGWDARHPVAIPDQEIEAVRTMVNAPVSNIEPYPYMSEGDRIQVAKGPLAGLDGFVVYVKNRARVVVSVTMLARSISAEVDAMDLTLVERSLPQAA